MDVDVDVVEVDAELVPTAAGAPVSSRMAALTCAEVQDGDGPSRAALLRLSKSSFQFKRNWAPNPVPLRLREVRSPD